VGGTGPTASVASVARASSASDETITPEPETPVQTPVETAPPTTQAPAAPAAPTTKAPTATTPTTRKATTTTVARAAPAAPAAPAPTTPTTVKVRSGQRVAFTTAGVQAAITALHQRIPLFAPNDAQLRTFADAVCTSFDQGQTQAQVQATIRDAVSRIQGQSLSDADAAFMVQTVTQLRCPGYLP
jgi:hypothetical protein